MTSPWLYRLLIAVGVVLLLGSVIFLAWLTDSLAHPVPGPTILIPAATP